MRKQCNLADVASMAITATAAILGHLTPTHPLDEDLTTAIALLYQAGEHLELVSQKIDAANATSPQPRETLTPSQTLH
jgi:hypothetical protein